MVKLNRWGPKRDIGLTKDCFESHFKARFALHSQTVQGLTQKCFTNLYRTCAKRNKGDKKARYPLEMPKALPVLPVEGAVQQGDEKLPFPAYGAGPQASADQHPTQPPAGQDRPTQVELGYHEVRVSLIHEAIPSAKGKT